MKHLLNTIAIALLTLPLCADEPRPEPRQQLERLHKALQQAEREEHPEQVKEIRARIQEIERAAAGQREGAGNNEPAARLQHLREAAVHLQAAGMEKEAAQLREQAAHGEHEIAAQRPAAAPAEAQARQFEEIGKAIQNLTQQVQRLNERVEKLQRERAKE